MSSYEQEYWQNRTANEQNEHLARMTSIRETQAKVEEVLDEILSNVRLLTFVIERRIG